MEQSELMYLEHHQAKGAHWGVFHGPPYPLNESKSTGKSIKKNAKTVEPPKGFKGALLKYRAKQEAKKKHNAQVESLKKAREAKIAKEKEAKERAAKKEQIAKSKDAALIYKNSDLFTTDELRELKNRLDAENSIKTMAPSVVDKGQKFISTASTLSISLEKAASVIENGTRAYNDVAKIINSVSNTNLPIVRDSNQNNQKNQNNQNKQDNQKNNGGKQVLPKGSENHLKYDAYGKLKYQKTITDDGNGNRQIVERDLDKKKKKQK